MESAILTGSVSLLSSNSSTCEALSARRSTVSRPVLLSSAVSTVSTVSAAGALSLLLRMETETRRLRWVDDDVTHFKQASAGVDEARRLARADKRPDWKVGVTYGRRDPMYGDMASVGVSIDLPMFAGKRQNPRIAASESLVQGGRFDREAIRRELVAQLDADLADHAMHLSRLRNARETLVPLARRRAELDRDSYAAGKLDLGTALLSTLALAEAEVETLNREADVARDAVRINITYGEERP